MRLVGPDAADHHRGEQDETGSRREGCLEATRSPPSRREITGRRGGRVGIRPDPALQGATAACEPLSEQGPHGLAGGQGRCEEAAQRQGETGPGPGVDRSQAASGDIRAQPGRGAQAQPGQEEAAHGQEDTSAGHPDTPGNEEPEDAQGRNQRQQYPQQNAQDPGGHEGIQVHRGADQQVEAARCRRGDGQADVGQQQPDPFGPPCAPAQAPGAPPGRCGGDQHGHQGEDELEPASGGHRQQHDDDGQHGGGGRDGRDDDAQQQSGDGGGRRRPVAVLLRGGQVDLGLPCGRGAGGTAGLLRVLTEVMCLIVRGIIRGRGLLSSLILGELGVARSVPSALGVFSLRGILDLRLLIQVGEVGDLLGGEAIELGAFLVSEQVGTHQSGQHEVASISAYCAGQGQQRPGQDEVDQECSETPLAQGEQEAGRQGPHQCRPGPQRHLPGHCAGGEPCPQCRQGHGQEHQGTDERTGLQTHQSSQGRR